jgi:hypothetical protein
VHPSVLRAVLPNAGSENGRSIQRHTRPLPATTSDASVRASVRQCAAVHTPNWHTEVPPPKKKHPACRCMSSKLLLLPLALHHCRLLVLVQAADNAAQQALSNLTRQALGQPSCIGLAPRVSVLSGCLTTAAPPYTFCKQSRLPYGIICLQSTRLR